MFYRYSYKSQRQRKVCLVPSEIHGRFNPLPLERGQAHPSGSWHKSCEEARLQKSCSKNNFAKQAQHKFLSPSAKGIQRGIKWQRRLPMGRAASNCWLEEPLRNTRVSFPHGISSSLYIQGKLYFYECLPWKNIFFSLWVVCKNSRKQPIWLQFQSLEGMASPLQEYHEGISRRCLWQPSWRSMAGTLPCEAYSPGRLQLGGLTWKMFWKEHVLSWRCLFRSNKLSGAFLEVSLEKDLCPTALLILLKSKT